MTVLPAAAGREEPRSTTTSRRLPLVLVVAIAFFVLPTWADPPERATDGRLNAYELPSEEIPLLYLWDLFFVMFGDRLDDSIFLERLGIEPGSLAATALANAADAYQESRPTPSERAATRSEFQALVDDPDAYKALGYVKEGASAMATARVVHNLKHGLENAGASLSGVRLYIEQVIRPNVAVTSDNPRGADDSYFEHGAAFCQESRLANCMVGGGQ